MGTSKIGNKPGVSKMEYAFNSDHTFVIISSNLSREPSGQWQYDISSNKVILTSNGSSYATVTFLGKSEIVVVLNADDKIPKDMSNFKMVFVAKGK